MGLKQCTKCYEFKEESEEFYFQKKTGKFRPDCKECNKKAAKVWRKNNPEKVKAGCKKYYKENKEELRELNKQWKKENPEKSKKLFRE